MKKTKNILGIDIGFGHVKVTLMSPDFDIIKMFKFPTQIGITKRMEHVNDSKIKEYKGHHFYVGENASHVDSSNMIDISEYKNLEYYSPLLMNHALDMIEETPEIVVTGLSIAHISNSGHFRDNLMNYEINGIEYKFPNLFVLPQGAGTKLTLDKYLNNFPNIQTEFLGKSTYIVIDCGFNSVDLLLVVDGEAKANLFHGIEKEGVMKVAALVAKKVHEDYSRKITLSEAKDILDTNTYKLRGVKHDMSIFVQDVKKKYLSELMALVESKYPGIIDKADFMSISGGGSYIFKRGSEDGFMRIPKSHNEYYNSIGFALYGIKKS